MSADLRVDCAVCGREIELSPSRLAKSLSGLFTCSRECLGQRMAAAPNCTCPVCQKRFHVRASELEGRKWPPCCSRECGAEYRTVAFSGAANHQFGLKGELNPTFKSDLRISNYGYLMLRRPAHPFRMHHNFVFFHRLVVEEHLRYAEPDSPHLVEVESFDERFLDPAVEVHHENENKLDNRLANLKITTRSEHVSEHNLRRAHLYVRDDAGRFVLGSGRVRHLRGSARSLVKKHFFDAGLDICSAEDGVVRARGKAALKAGLELAVPDGFVGLVYSRSGLSFKHGIEVGAGCIDSSYRGEVQVILYNHSDTDFRVTAGDRIAQLLTIPVNLSHYENAEVLDETERGASGFGSTGIRAQDADRKS